MGFAVAMGPGGEGQRRRGLRLGHFASSGGIADAFARVAAAARGGSGGEEWLAVTLG